MKYTYLSLLSSDDYLQGALVLNESLKRVNSKYKLHVLITANVSQRIDDILNKIGVNTIRVDKTITVNSKIQKQNENVGYKYWNNTFDCLLAFELCQFDKIVFLDSDLICWFWKI